MTTHYAELCRLGVATLYEAAGRNGLIDLPLHQIIPGSCVAGPARTIWCGHGDNLMVHAAMATIQPGEVLVISMPDPAPVALVGELLATQALAQGAAGILVDAAIRDADALRSLGLPIWARFIRVRGATRTKLGTINQPITIGGMHIAPGDAIILDADGAIGLPKQQIAPTITQAQQREARETALRAQFQAGQLSIDIYHLRDQVVSVLPPPQH